MKLSGLELPEEMGITAKEGRDSSRKGVVRKDTDELNSGVFRMEHDGPENGSTSRCDSYGGYDSASSEASNSSIEVVEETPLLKLRQGAFSAPEKRWTESPGESENGLGPRSFLDRFNILHKGIEDFRRDLYEVRKGFEGILFPSHDAELEPIPKVDTTGAFVKLEVMESWEVDFCVVALNVAIAVGFLYTTLSVSLSKDGWQNAVMGYFSKYSILAINFSSFLLAMFYIVRIIALGGTERTDEQFWTCVLVSSGLLGQSPFTEFFGVSENLISCGYDQLNRMFHWVVVVDATYAACTYFFLVCSAHSYRVVGHWEFQRLRFYFPKFVLISLYVSARIYLEMWGSIHLGFIPLTRLINLSFFLSAGWMTPLALMAVILTTLSDCAILLWFYKEISTTRIFLARLNYVETRTKQLGFRFFIYLSVCFLAAIFVTDAYLMGTTPASNLEDRQKGLDYIEMSPVTGKLGLSIMYFTWLALTVYGNYPSRNSRTSRDGEMEGVDADRGMRLILDERKTFLYKHRDWKDRETASRMYSQWNNVFIMELQILMINCAWLSYIPMNKQEEKQSPSAVTFEAELERQDTQADINKVDMYEITAGKGLRILRHIYDEPNDGHCIILEGENKVIVSFGGTRQGSMKNWRANFQFNQVTWSDWFQPVSIADLQNFDDEENPQLAPRSLLLKVAKEVKTFAEVKVHAGFASMYKRLRAEMMSVLVSIYNRDKASGRKQLFFTGHSLGGAMCTIASYDCALNYRRIGLRSRQQIQVTTFGLPKIGNLAWKTSFEKEVPRHWRFVLASDVVTKMPQDWSYFHVGVKVLLDWSGVILIDPSFVEVRWWHTVYTSTTLHTRASYFLALQACCRRYRDKRGIEDDLADAFWSWPIEPHYIRLFVNVEPSPAG